MATFDNVMESIRLDVKTNVVPESEPRERLGEAYSQGLLDRLRRRDNLDYFIQGVTRHHDPVYSNHLGGPDFFSCTTFAPVTIRPERVDELLELHLSHISQDAPDSASCGLAIRITVSDEWDITEKLERGDVDEPEIPPHVIARIYSELGFRYLWIKEKMTSLNGMRSVINLQSANVEQDERLMWTRGFTGQNADDQGGNEPLSSSPSEELIAYAKEGSVGPDMTRVSTVPRLTTAIALRIQKQFSALRIQKQLSTKGVKGQHLCSGASALSGPGNVGGLDVSLGSSVRQVTGSNAGLSGQRAFPTQYEKEYERVYDSPILSPIPDASCSPMPNSIPDASCSPMPANEARGKKRVNDQPVAYPRKRDTECHLAVERVSLAFAGAVGLLPNLLTDSDARHAFKAAVQEISRLSNDIGGCPEAAIADEYSTARERLSTDRTDGE